MNFAWLLLELLALVCSSESRCSPTSYYKNCWIRRFPGVFIDIAESQRRGAQLLKFYQEETALTCSRTCCLSRNFSCNLALFHYETAQETANCFHLHCPSLESCIISLKANVVLYNVTKGVDPDLLVFGKYFTSNVRVLPHLYDRVNVSDLLPSDKRQFIHPPDVPPQTSTPSTHASTAHGSVGKLTAQLSSSPPKDSTQTPPTTAQTSGFASPHRSTVLTTPGHHIPETSPAQSSPNSFTSIPHPTSRSSSAATTQLIESESSNETKTISEQNQTAGDEGGQGTDGEEVGSGWHVAGHTLLVAVAMCVAVLLSCCCSVLLVVSWRGQRKRVGRYRTSWRGRKASMRLIKYVLVRENP